MTNYFAYGSNMDISRMMDRGVRIYSANKAVLKGHRLVFNKKASGGENGYANIVKSPKYTVQGVLYGIEKSGIKKLDKYEGFPSNYYREIIDVYVNRWRVSTWVYIAQPEMTQDGLTPTPMYLSHLIRGGAIYLDKSYFDFLRRVEC
jgi:gamma-glutamylcyclotransferase